MKGGRVSNCKLAAEFAEAGTDYKVEGHDFQNAERNVHRLGKRLLQYGLELYYVRFQLHSKRGKFTSQNIAMNLPTS